MNYVTIEQLRNPPLDRLYVILYVACISAAGLSDWPSLGNFAMYLKVFALGGFGLAVLRLLWKSDYKRLKPLSELLIIFAIPLLFVYLLSMGLWSVKTMDTMYISRGTQKILFQFITVAVVIGAAYLFGEKAAEYTFYGLVISNFTIMALEMVRYGISSAIVSIINSFLTLSNASGFLYKIEIHDITFCMGLYMLYFITQPKNTKWRRIRIAISGFFFIIGFKRIAILAISLSIGLGFLLRRMKPRHACVMIITTQFILIALSYAYIYIISTGLWTQIMTELEVDMAGRNKIYQYISQFYSLSPSYVGYGFEYTVAMLRGMRDTGTQIIHATGIHCDVLKQYIELGFWGYLIWMLYTYVFQSIWYFRRYGIRAMILFFSSGVYAWVTYMTDNTIYYFWLSMTLKMVMISLALGQFDKKTANCRSDPRDFKLADLKRD